MNACQQEGSDTGFLIALYHESSLVPASSGALQQLVRVASKALPRTRPAAALTAAQQLVAWADSKARLHSTVCRVTRTIIWAAQAVCLALQKDQPSRTQEKGMLVLHQLAQPQLAHALADACTCLAPPQLPANNVAASSSCSPPAGSAVPGAASSAVSRHWATLLQQAVHAAATTDCFHATQQQQFLPALPAAEAGGLDTVDRQVLYGADYADVILACAAAARDLILCASTAAQRQTADVPGGPCASEAVLQALQQSRLLDVVCGTLLRIDPARPPLGTAAAMLFPDLTGAIDHAVKAVERALLIVESGDADESSAPAQSCTARTTEAVQQLVIQPHVLKLLYAVTEAFLQEPPPPVASMLAALRAAAGGSNASADAAGGGRSSSSPTATAVPADAYKRGDGAMRGGGTTGSPGAAAAAFLPSSSADDELSNKLLQRTWPLLAACPLVRYMHLWTSMDPEGALPSTTTSSSQAAAADGYLVAIFQMFQRLYNIGRCLLFLPFTPKATSHPLPPAIKAHLPGLSGFCRIAVRMARWSGRTAEATCAVALLPGTRGAARHPLLDRVPWMIAMSGVAGPMAFDIVLWCKVRRGRI